MRAISHNGIVINEQPVLRTTSSLRKQRPSVSIWYVLRSFSCPCLLSVLFSANQMAMVDINTARPIEFIKYSKVCHLNTNSRDRLPYGIAGFLHFLAALRNCYHSNKILGPFILPQNIRYLEIPCVDYCYRGLCDCVAARS